MTDNTSLQRCSVFGLGKLGSPLAAVLAHWGHEVIGYDVSKEAVRRLDQGVAPVEETGLAEMIAKNAERISGVHNGEDAVLGSDVTFVIVPTPSDENGRFQSRFALDAAATIGTALQRKDGFHLVVLTSTVMPGATAEEFVPALEQHSGKQAGVDFGVCYNPEFIALGSVIHDMLNPDFVLIGESDPKSGEMLAKLYQHSCETKPPVRRMNFVNAEITKIAVNTFVTTKISYANMLAEVCERLADADVDVVTNAIGQDSRIGTKYLKGATGYGGPCFPRDNKAFSRIAHDVGANPGLAEATDSINDHQITRLKDLVATHASAGNTVGILGLSYKPETAVVEEAQGCLLAAALAQDGYNVIVFDPQALENAHRTLGDDVTYAEDATALLQTSDVVVIPTAWPEFQRISDKAVEGTSTVIIDCWRIFKPTWGGSNTLVVHTGQGQSATETIGDPA